jgi:hypothetical protein
VLGEELLELEDAEVEAREVGEEAGPEVVVFHKSSHVSRYQAAMSELHT